MQSLLFALYGYILSPLLFMLVIALVAYVILGWMAAYGHVSRYKNEGVYQVYGVLQSVIEPLCQPFRRLIPPIGGRIDLAPLLLLLTLQFVNGYLLPTLIGLVPF